LALLLKKGFYKYPFDFQGILTKITEILHNYKVRQFKKNLFVE